MTSPATDVILGGTSGIGAAIARRIASPDGTVVLNYLQNRSRAEELAERLPGTVRLVEGNVADKAVQEKIADAAGVSCRALIHSVAVTAFKPLTDVRSNQWDLTMGVSARSLLEITRTLRGPLVQASGSIVAISSQGAVRHVPSYGALGPAKAALESLVRGLAVELAPKAIRVNGVRAGLVQGAAISTLVDQLERLTIERTPLRRLARPEEIAAVVAFLIGEDASWVTGQIIDVDGGMGLI